MLKLLKLFGQMLEAEIVADTCISCAAGSGFGNGKTTVCGILSRCFLRL